MAASACQCPNASADTKKKLLFACSGAANVAEIADRVARQLTREGLGQMFCLTGLGAEIPSMIQTARDAGLNLVIDGCPMDCARKIFEKQGMANAKFIRVTDHGIVKAKGVDVSDEQVQSIASLARQALTIKATE